MYQPTYYSYPQIAYPVQYAILIRKFFQEAQKQGRKIVLLWCLFDSLTVTHLVKYLL